MGEGEGGGALVRLGSAALAVRLPYPEVRRPRFSERDNNEHIKICFKNNEIKLN